MTQTDTTDDTQVLTAPAPSDTIQVPDFITETQADRVFRYLDGVAVHIEKDPTVMGPSYVHEKLKDCRDFSIEVENLLVTYYDVERRVKNLLAGQKEAIKARLAELMALNTWVGKGRSAGDREARANMSLTAEIEAKNNLTEQLVNVGYVLRAIELKREGLNRTNNDIKKQVSLMEFARGTNYNLGADSEYDNLVVQGTTNPSSGTPMDQSDSDVVNLFGDGMPDIEEAPESIDPELTKHMSDDTEDGYVEEDDGGMDDFLQTLQVDDLPEDPEEVEEIDIASLINGATSLINGATGIQTPTDSAKKTFDIDDEDEDVVDIGAFFGRDVGTDLGV